MTNVPINPALTSILPPHQQIAPCVQPSDGLLHPLGMMQPESTQNDLPLALCQTPHSIRPTQAIIEAHRTLATKAAAQQAGEEWAEAEGTPEALLTSTFAFLASTTLNSDYSVPKSYWEAMKRPNLWVFAMEDELRVMKEKGIWEVVNISNVPSGKKMVDC
ncbi:hypothetical protein C0989_009370, partial [Termitomyces sp. Mn162]